MFILSFKLGFGVANCSNLVKVGWGVTTMIVKRFLPLGGLNLLAYNFVWPKISPVESYKMNNVQEEEIKQCWQAVIDNNVGNIDVAMWALKMYLLFEKRRSNKIVTIQIEEEDWNKIKKMVLIIVLKGFSLSYPLELCLKNVALSGNCPGLNVNLIENSLLEPQRQGFDIWV